MNAQTVDMIIEKWDSKPDCVIEMMHDIQSELKFLPKEAIEQISIATGETVAKLHGIATFYQAFSLTQRGEHHVCVCMGTPCHAMGATRLVEALERELDIKCGETTDDLKFTLEISGCVGTCGLAPIVDVDGKLHAFVEPAKVKKLLKKYM